jgi:transcriptional regulator with XRE-family HTH domain
MKDLNSFPERLKYLIEKYKTTQQKLADYCNTDKALISKYCSGTHKPTNASINKISMFFDCSQDWLKEGKGKSNDRFDYSKVAAGEFQNKVKLDKEPDGSFNLIIRLEQHDVEMMVNKIFFQKSVDNHFQQ